MRYSLKTGKPDNIGFWCTSLVQEPLYIDIEPEEWWAIDGKSLGNSVSDYASAEQNFDGRGVGVFV